MEPQLLCKARYASMESETLGSTTLKKRRGCDEGRQGPNPEETRGRAVQGAAGRSAMDGTPRSESSRPRCACAKAWVSRSADMRRARRTASFALFCIASPWRTDGKTSSGQGRVGRWRDAAGTVGGSRRAASLRAHFFGVRNRAECGAGRRQALYKCVGSAMCKVF